MQIVTGFPGYAHFVTLNLRLHFQLAVFNQLDDLLRQLGFNPLLKLGVNAVGFTAVLELFRDLQRRAVNAALGQFFTQDIKQLLNLKIGFAGNLDGFIFSFSSKLAGTLRKSQRVPRSREAFSTALRTSCISISETMSKDGILLPPE